MRTKFYWISFLVHGFGQRSDFPSEPVRPAEREERHRKEAKNKNNCRSESVPQGAGVSETYSSHSFPPITF